MRGKQPAARRRLTRFFLLFTSFTLVSSGAGHVTTQQPTPRGIERPSEPLYSMVKQEGPAVVETLRQLVNI